MIYKATSGKVLGPLISALSGHEKSKTLLLHRTWVLLLTFLIYATYRLSRRPLSIAKAVFHNEACIAEKTNETLQWSHSLVHSGLPHNSTQRSCGWAPFDGADGKQLLGMLDTVFLLLYTLGTYGNGYVADRLNIRYFLATSLTSCGLLAIALGLSKTLQIHQLWYFVLLQALAGYASATMPAMVAVVGSWFGTAKKGLIFGIWNWHGSMGTILGSVVAGAFIETNWSLSFIVPGVICLVMAVVVLLFLVAKPAEVGLDIRPVVDLEKTAKIIEEKGSGKAISFWNALMIPGVIEFSIAQFFTKLVSYTFLYWLPLFLKETTNISASKSAYVSIIFDLGGCVGSMAAGLMADRTGTSALTCIFFLLFSIPSLYSLDKYTSASSIWLSQILQFTTGLLINGPFSLIMSTVSANLACKVPSKSAMATVSGIVNGTGSIGAAIGPLLAGIVSKNGNWKNVFYMAIGSVICAAISLLRIGFQEFRALKK